MMKWKVATGVLAILLIASLALQAAGINLFTKLSPKSGAAAQQASKPNLIPTQGGHRWCWLAGLVGTGVWRGDGARRI